MPTDDFIIELFIRVDTMLGDTPKHPDAHLYPSELVTLALLFALKGVGVMATVAIRPGCNSVRARSRYPPIVVMETTQHRERDDFASVAT